LKRSLLSIAVTSLVIAPLTPAAAADSRERLAVKTILECADGGGARLTLVVANEGVHPVVIDPDLHLLLEIAGSQGRRPGVIVFLFPAPGWNRIPPGETRTFLIDLGTPFEGEPGLDLSGGRLLLEIQIWLRGVAHPWERMRTFPACNDQ